MPVVSDAVDIAALGQAVSEGDYVTAGLIGAGIALPIVGGALIARPYRKSLAAKNLGAAGSGVGSAGCQKAAVVVKTKSADQPWWGGEFLDDNHLQASCKRPSQYESGIPTPYGVAHRDPSAEAVSARSRVEDGATLYRIETTGRSEGVEAQFWALQSPLSPGYANLDGIPPANVANPNFVEIGTLKACRPYITLKAPRVGSNTGGGIEVVVPPYGVQVDYSSASQ